MDILLDSLSKEEKLIVNHHLRADLYERLVELEKYKLCSKQSIKDYIARNYKELQVTTVSANSSLKYLDEFKIYYEESEDCAIVYVPILIIEVSPNYLVRLELTLGHSSVKFFYITPYNYNLLKGDLMIDYNIIFRVIIADCIKKKVANLHIESYSDNGKVKYLIKYRINDKLEIQNMFAFDKDSLRDLVNYLIKGDTKTNNDDMLTSKGVATSSVDFITNSGIDLRITANRVEYGTHCVVRIQSKSNTNRSIEELGFDPDIMESLYKNHRFRTGLVLFTGAKSTGKNTSAYSFIRLVMKKDLKILSYESPIEVLMPFPQLDYNNNENLLLDSILLSKKQDVDLVFINEIPGKKVAFALRDLINSSIGVISTLHIDRIWHLPYKLYEYYGTDYKDIISQLRVVYNQKMFNKICKNCMYEASVLDLSDKHYSKYLSELGLRTIKQNDGCAMCGGLNSKQFIGIQPYCEFLEFSPQVKDDLLRMEAPWQMEQYIKEVVTKNNNNLEYYIKKGLESGDLSINSIDQFI